MERSDGGESSTPQLVQEEAPLPNETDVVVVGAGNAGLCAALAARQSGADVIVLERAPRPERGGNSGFTAGSMRVAFERTEDLVQLMPDLSDREREETDFGSYPAATFFDDLARSSEYRADADLIDVVAETSFETLLWLRAHGIRFLPQYGRQAFKREGRFTFWGGLVLEVSGGGQGLIETLFKAVDRAAIHVHYEARAVELVVGSSGIQALRVRRRGELTEVAAGAVVLASGGFEADPQWRARYLGRGWDLAKVRGTRFNSGDGIVMALDAGAAPYGHWSGCHSVAWDYNAPEVGDLVVRDGFQKHSFPFGIVVNRDGKRFLDEGRDFWSNTYSEYGATILEQPGQIAWQVFDQKAAPLLRDEYRIREVTKVTASSLAELAHGMEGIDSAEFLRTVAAFNDSTQRNIKFDPNRLDGRSTIGLDPPKSNWANPIETPPFEAYAVTCGISFTYGGIRVTPKAEVQGTDSRTIPGLYAAGEVVGGLYYFNCPAGVGLTAGAVLGRLAGTNAAAAAQERR